MKKSVYLSPTSIFYLYTTADAWNQTLNPPKRKVDLEYRDCCYGCIALGVDVVDRERRKRTSLMTQPLKRATSSCAAISVLIQIIVAITIIVIVAVQLADPARVDAVGMYTPSQCYLGSPAQGNTLCIYTYVTASLGLLLSIVLSIVLVCIALFFES